jgi:hypothetical protein
MKKILLLLSVAALTSCSKKFVSVETAADAPSVSYVNNTLCVSGTASLMLRTDSLIPLLTNGAVINYSGSQVRFYLVKASADSTEIKIDYSGCLKVK